jgi:cytidylate kinase
VARRLGIRYLDTGAMYRAFAWKALADKLDPSQGPALGRMIRACRLELPADRVLLDGQDITDRIRTQAVTETASIISTHPEVRAELVRLQQDLGRREPLVTEGRDQGTVVFPDAEHKFFLVADLDERARRRRRERPESETFEAVRDDMKRRDERDTNRAASPLRPAPGAVTIDTTRLSIDEVVERILSCISGKMEL